MSNQAMVFQVWHAKNPTFGLAPLLGLEHERWPDDYVHVADVWGVSLEHVFELTQEWGMEEDIFLLEEPRRSTSVGDVVITPNGAIYRCERFDWSLIDWAA